MTTFTCPAGHASESSDYCDTCGMPIAASGAATSTGVPGAGDSEAAPGSGAPAAAGSSLGGSSTGGSSTGGSGTGGSAAGGSIPATASAPAVQSCPSCSADNPADALFCEACGYDFTTGTMPRRADPAPSLLDLGAATAPGPVAPAVAMEWVAEIWVDPAWYEVEESEEPCPSPGLPVVVPLRNQSVLIGRPSASRNIHPEIDCSSDVGVSRRHAQLTTDGQRWWVEDLQSSNGTYVGPASGPLPEDPIPPGQRRELDDDDRVYLGAWTRLVVRRATPEEQAGQA